MRQWKHENLGARPMKQVEMAFKCPMKNDVAGAHAMTPGVSRFIIAAGQNHGSERFAMTVPRKLFGSGVSHPAGRGAPERSV